MICEDISYVLKIIPDKIAAYLDSDNKKDEEEGCEEGFDICYEINEKISSAVFINDVLIYLNTKNKLNYSINGQNFPITTLDKTYHLMGYLSNLGRIFLISKSFEVISYTFPQSFINYQISVLQNNMVEADKVINSLKFRYLLLSQKIIMKK